MGGHTDVQEDKGAKGGSEGAREGRGEQGMEIPKECKEGYGLAERQKLTWEENLVVWIRWVWPCACACVRVCVRVRVCVIISLV